MLRTSKRLIPILVILFWLVMMGMLIYREAVLPRWHQRQASPGNPVPQNVWFGLYFGEAQRVGFVHLHTVPETRGEDPGAAMHLTARLEFPLFGQDTRFKFSGDAWQSSKHGLRDFDFTLGSGEHDMRIQGVAEGGVIQAVLHTAGEQMNFTFPVGPEVLLSGGMGLNSLSFPVLEPGEVAYVNVFDPTTMSTGRAKLEALQRETIDVAGESVDAVVIAAALGGIRTHAWVSPRGEVLKAETPLGIILKKITPEEALESVQPDESANLVRSLSVKMDGPAPDADAEQVRFRVTGLPEWVTIPEDARQRRDGDIWTIERQNPTDDSIIEPIAPEDMEAALASDLFIQANHPRIQETAASIAGERDTAWESALLLHDWVYENLAKEHVLSVPSALDVLEQRTGDCNEHAVLYTALARSIGIPTRVAIGLAWSDVMQAFGYHAWVEVYIGRWMALDPTFGERIASPLHIKLLTGGIDQWPRLLSYVGAIKIEIVE